jgi:hypothetical protein
VIRVFMRAASGNERQLPIIAHSPLARPLPYHPVT